MFQYMLAIWSLVPLPFLNPAWTSESSRFMYGWILTWRIENYEWSTENFYRDCSGFYIYIYSALSFYILIHYFPKGSGNFHLHGQSVSNFFVSTSALNIITGLFFFCVGMGRMWGYYYLLVYMWLKVDKNFLNIDKWIFFSNLLTLKKTS